MSIKGKPTSFDIAYQAGVSQSTVSRALRDSPLVSLETRNRIKAIARELHYTVDKNASSLRTQRPGTLALLFFEDPSPDESHINPFFLSMLGSITRACARQGYDLLISFQQLSDDWHADFRDSNKADGLILLGYGDWLQYRGKLEKLVEQGTPFVRWGAVEPDQPGLSIGCDNYQGGGAVTRHLLGTGRRRIAFIGTASDQYPEFAERWHGCADALAAAGREVDPQLRVDAVSAQDAGYAACRDLLDRNVRFDAIFAASDLIAIGAMQALAERGLVVPGDVAVAGFDDIPMASCVNPSLTTASQDTQRAGDLLVDALLRRIKGETVDSLMYPVRLIVRRSCGAA